MKEKGTLGVNVMEADSFWVNCSKQFLEYFAKGNEFDKSRSCNMDWCSCASTLGKPKNLKNKYKMQRKTSSRKGSV